MSTVKANKTKRPAPQRPKKARRTGQVLAILLVAVFLLTLLPMSLFGVIQKQMYPVKYVEEVEKWSEIFGVNPYFIYAVIRTESSFDPLAESAAGARGLMQMTEETFDWLKPTLAPGETVTYKDLYDPDTSIRFGTYYLALSIQRYGEDLPTAAAAYHSGWGTVDRLLGEGDYSPDGTRLTTFPYDQMNHYVNKVNKSYQKYLSLYSG